MSSRTVETKKTTTSSSGKYTPKTQMRTTVIQRSSAGAPFFSGIGGGAGGTTMRKSVRMSSGPASFGQGTVAHVTKEGVQGVNESRVKEKQEMQGLNDRFCKYIENNRLQKALNDQLLAENERLRKLKAFDIDTIKEMYEDELNSARKCIDDLSDGKAELDAKLAGLEDELEQSRAETAEANGQLGGLRTDIDKLINQMAVMEGDAKAHQLTNDQLKKENQHLKDTIARLQADLKRCRGDLDTETAVRIGKDGECQTLSEELEFVKNMYETQIAEMKKLIDQQTPAQHYEQTFKGELQAAINDIRQCYDEQLDAQRMEMEMKMENQLREIRSRENRDTGEVMHVKEEVKKLKGKMSELTRRCADLEAENARLKQLENERLRQIAELERELSDLERDSSKEISELKTELEECLVQIQTLNDSKLSLELEIAAYRKLLEGEEGRAGMTQVFEHVTDTRSSGGQKLADIIGSSSFGGQSEGKLIVHKKAKGQVCISEMSPDGKYVTIENTSSGMRKKAQDLFGWKVVRKAQNGSINEYLFDDHITLDGGQTCKIFGKSSVPSDYEYKRENGRTAKFPLWGSGSCELTLLDENKMDKSSMTCTHSG